MSKTQTRKDKEMNSEMDLYEVFENEQNKHRHNIKSKQQHKRRREDPFEKACRKASKRKRRG